ncbi:MAG: glycosyltransferase, partial [Limisphaerales bacterium]
ITWCGLTISMSHSRYRSISMRLRIGGGTRLKIIESIAMGTPVVSTSLGAQGLGLCHDNEILLADTPAAFAEQTARALKDAHLRKSLQRAGLEAVCSRLSWKTIGKDLNELYARHFASPQTPKRAAAMNPA